MGPQIDTKNCSKTFLKWQSIAVVTVGLLLVTFPCQIAAAARGSSDRHRGLVDATISQDLARQSLIKKKIPPIPPNPVCSSVDNFQFEQSLLITFRGRPGSVTDVDLIMLQRAIIQAYNQVAACPSVDGGFLNLLQVTISRNDVNSYGSTITETASANITQQFIFIATVQGTCRGCQTTPFQLFSSTSQRRDRFLTTLPSKTSLAENYGGAAGKHKAIDPPRPLRKLCVCPVPSESNFVKSFNTMTAMLPSSIDSLVDVTELESYSPCNPTSTSFQTVISLDFTEGSLNLTSAEDMQSQYSLLEQAVLQSYNNLNALSTGDVCDNYFLVLTDAQVVVSPGSTALNSTSVNQRNLGQSSSSSSSFNIIVTGNCRGCPGSPPPLFNDASGRRRQLNTWPMARVERRQTDKPAERAKIKIKDAPSTWSFHDRRLPFVSGLCYCPVDTTQFRRPTESEFLDTLNSRLGLLEAANLTSIVGSATDAIQGVAVNCSSEVNYFEDTVDITLGGNINLTSAEETELTQAFLTSYNSLIQEYCDPLFRTVVSVQVVGVVSAQKQSGGTRRLAPSSSSGSKPTGVSKSTLVLYVRGSCRGCSSSTPLFNDAAGRRRKLDHISDNQSSLVLSKVQAGSTSSTRRRNEHRRWLQEANFTNQCYCNVAPLGNGAPNTTEFITVFTQTLASSNVSSVVTSISETVTTASPTLYPSTRPALAVNVTRSPSLHPILPTLSPTFYANHSNHPMPSAPPTKTATSVPFAIPKPTSMPSVLLTPAITSKPTATPVRSPSTAPTQPPSAFPSVEAIQTIAPTNSPTKTSVCNERDRFRFQQAVLLTFTGRPAAVSDADVEQLENRMIQVYNQVAACYNVSGGFLHLLQVQIFRDEVISFGSSNLEAASANITQQFTVPASVLGACRGCKASPFRLFSDENSARRELLSSTTNSISSHRVDEQWERHLANLCVCPVPSQSSFIDSYNLITFPSTSGRRLDTAFPSSIDNLVDIIELDRYSPCNPVNKSFETFLTLDFTGGAPNLVDASDLQSQYLLIEQAVLQSYNNLNSLGTGDVCDNFFLTLTDAQIVASSESTDYNLTFVNQRNLVQSTSSYTSFTIIVTGNCRGCPGSPPPLFNDVSGRRRQLHELPPTVVEEWRQTNEQTERAETNAKYVPSTYSFQDRRRLPLVSGSCYCPVNTTQFRRPTESEFLDTLNNQLGLLEAANLTSIVASATGTIQDVPVNCSSEVNYFEDTVEITLGGDTFESTNITSEEANELTQTFLTTYNSLIQEYCDPLFRTVLSVQLVGIANRRVLVEQTGSYVLSRSNRLLAPSNVASSSESKSNTVSNPTVTLIVQGSCRGCPSSTPLYNDAAGRRLEGFSVNQTSSIKQPMEHANGRSLLQQNSEQHRWLQEATPSNLTDQCYCNVDSLGNRAPNETEFIIAYNQNLVLMNISSSATSISENVATSSPSMLPTIRTTRPTTHFPTKLPRPPRPPTSIPTSLPTVLPTQIPTKPPTTFPVASPTTTPSSIPTIVPTAMATKLPTVLPVAPPTKIPTFFPREAPTLMPNNPATLFPTAPPPTMTPTLNPSRQNSQLPSTSDHPSKQPTVRNSQLPSTSDRPSHIPSDQPSIATRLL